MQYAGDKKYVPADESDRHTVVTNNMDDIQKTRASTTMYNVDIM